VGQEIFPYDHYAFWRECPTEYQFQIEALLRNTMATLAVDLLSRVLSRPTAS